MNPLKFSLDEYYPWREEADAYYAWKRQFLNFEFLSYERKRVESIQEWYKNFRRLDAGQAPGEISYYTVPLNLSATWRRAINSFGRYQYIGLSALYNTLLVSLIGLVPQGYQAPSNYRLINITKSEKAIIYNEQMGVAEPVLIIEEWEYLPSHKPYVDVPYERKIIQKIIAENLIDKENISLSLQGPVLSSPSEIGLFGGIALSSMAGKSTFADELVKTMYLMVPPEFRGIKPPKSIYSGAYVENRPGIKFRVAERPYLENNIMKSLWGTEYEDISKELMQRYKFKGEYSLFSTLLSKDSQKPIIFKQLLLHFTDTEITLPYELNELTEADADLTKLRNTIDGDLWMQVVHARQFKPAITPTARENFINMFDLLKNDFDTILADTIKDEIERRHTIESILHPSKYNLKRIAQSLARSEESDAVSRESLKKARGLIVDNFYDFIGHPTYEKMRFRQKRRKNTARYQVVQTELINNPEASAKEIYDAVKYTELFDDLEDLKGLLDWLYEQQGLVIRSPDGLYTWVGKYTSF